MNCRDRQLLKPRYLVSSHVWYGQENIASLLARPPAHPATLPNHQPWILQSPIPALTCETSSYSISIIPLQTNPQPICERREGRHRAFVVLPLSLEEASPLGPPFPHSAYPRGRAMVRSRYGRVFCEKTLTQPRVYTAMAAFLTMIQTPVNLAMTSK